MLFARLPGLAEMIQRYNQHPDKAKFIVRYPVGDEANVWAEEVRAWLVSLGVPSRDIRLAVSAGKKDDIQLELEGVGGP